MPYVIRTYECQPPGGEHHRFEVMLASGEHPKFCPQCGLAVDASALPIPAKIAIGGSAIARSTDQTYRLLETSSAARAAELGAPALKVTDMKDGLREGDVAAKAPNNVVTAFNREVNARFGINYLQWQGGGGMGVGRPMPAGAPGQAFAGPGHIALHALQPEHDARVQETVARPTHRPYVGGR